MKYIIILFLSLIYTSVSFSALYAQAQCKDILGQGIYDYRDTGIIISTSNSFINWYKHFQSSSTFLNKMKEIEVDIPIDKITIGGGYSDDVTESEKFEQLIARYLSGSNNAKYELSEVIKSINPTIVDAWQKCINRSGVHIWIEFSESPDEFILAAKYEDDGRLSGPVIEGFDGLKSIDVIDDGAFLNKNKEINKNTQLSGRINRQNFIRNTNEAFTLIVTPKFGDSRAFKFPKKVTPPYSMSFGEGHFEVTNDGVILGVDNINDSKFITNLSIAGRDYRISTDLEFKNPKIIRDKTHDFLINKIDPENQIVEIVIVPKIVEDLVIFKDLKIGEKTPRLYEGINIYAADINSNTAERVANIFINNKLYRVFPGTDLEIDKFRVIVSKISGQSKSISLLIGN